VDDRHYSFGDDRWIDHPAWFTILLTAAASAGSGMDGRPRFPIRARARGNALQRAKGMDRIHGSPLLDRHDFVAARHQIL
jgi:hypothetical protein